MKLSRLTGLNLLLSFSLIGFIRHLRFKLLGQDILLSGNCLQCGSCCRELVLDIDGFWISNLQDFRELVKQNPAYNRFKYIRRGKEGLLWFRCTWLQKDGTCRDHINRLDICKTFPDRDMFFMKGSLPRTCGYRMTQGKPFEEILKRTMKKNPG